LFRLQSTINMAVNLHLIPAKGMTLPFISYGGSSLISLAYGMGMLVALTRERPRRSCAGGIMLAPSTGLMLANRAGRRCWWRPAARAVICFRPRRSPRRWRSAASRFTSRPTGARRAMAAPLPTKPST
jgi:hypothetical protein